MACLANAYANPIRQIDADAAWSALWSGEWTVVDHVEGPPSHAIVCDPAPVRPTAPLLSPDENRARGRESAGGVAQGDGRGLRALDDRGEQPARPGEAKVDAA